MPCGCFGGGSKKKSALRGSEDSLRPPKLPAEQPINKQQQQTPLTVVEEKTTLEHKGALNSKPQANNTGNGMVTTSEPNATTTPESKVQTEVDGNKSSGARSRAELYAKRREFFRPLYDVSLNTSNQRFGTPRSSNTLPSRGKHGAFISGDGSTYFTADGNYNISGNIADTPENSLMSMDDDTSANKSEPSVEERPPRPISQPSAIAGQWDEIVDDTRNEPQDEFHQKHRQIIQHSATHTSQVPAPPPPPKDINPHFVEFQEKHYKIFHEPESHVVRKLDPETDRKLAEKRITELDKLHTEIHAHHEKRVRQGPVDIDSLVEKYTEERWKKMIDKWESEGLVVEGGIVVVDDKGNAVERSVKNLDGNLVVSPKIADLEDELRKSNNRTGKGSESMNVEPDFENLGVITRTEEILIEKVNSNVPTTITTTTTTTTHITSDEILQPDQIESAPIVEEAITGAQQTILNEEYGNEKNVNTNIENQVEIQEGIDLLRTTNASDFMTENIDGVNTQMQDAHYENSAIRIDSEDALIYSEEPKPIVEYEDDFSENINISTQQEQDGLLEQINKELVTSLEDSRYDTVPSHATPDISTPPPSPERHSQEREINIEDNNATTTLIVDSGDCQPAMEQKQADEGKLATQINAEGERVMTDPSVVEEEVSKQQRSATPPPSPPL